MREVIEDFGMSMLYVVICGALCFQMKLIIDALSL